MGFAIDWEAVQWLWSLKGYPSDPLHADFHRKSLRGARPWAIGGEPYDPAAATARAREQGREFLAATAARLERFAAERGREGLIVFAIDTELLGHWWWEGPAWLEQVLTDAEAHGVELVTLGDALDRHPAEPRELRRSSWGEGKDLRTWDSPEVADLATAARRLELRVLRGARRGARARCGGARRPGAARGAGERLGVSRPPRSGGRLPLAAHHRSRSRAARDARHRRPGHRAPAQPGAGSERQPAARALAGCERIGPPVSGGGSA